MAKTINEAEVKHVAKLARLNLTNHEVGKFSEQLSAIVDYIQKLNELDTAEVEPLAHCLQVHNVLRQDTPRPSLTNDQALANAPQREDEYFKVPKILDDNSGA